MPDKHYGYGHISRLKKKFEEGKTTKEEIIELLLSYVIKGRDVKGHAKEIMKKSRGSFRNVIPVIESGEIKGLGEQTAVFFGVIAAFMENYKKDSFAFNTVSIKNQDDLVEYFRDKTAYDEKEAVYCVYLDAKNRVINAEKIGEGTLTQCVMYPREVVKLAMKKGALGIILVHNHPSGRPEPSESDKKITKKIVVASKEMDLTLLDHIIVGREGYYSFYENGLIDSYMGVYRRIVEAME
ncbi:MAG: RadC family protein [Candidatus Goldiibacteriota bacterium]